MHMLAAPVLRARRGAVAVFCTPGCLQAGQKDPDMLHLLTWRVKKNYSVPCVHFQSAEECCDPKGLCEQLLIRPDHLRLAI